MKIAIDAGHGLYTAGKRCLKSIDKKETREWVLNDRIADKLQKLLDTYNCEVLRVDDTTGQKDVSLATRCKSANNWGADVYVSIHHNAGINGGSGGGIVVYYYSSKAERKTQAEKLYDSLIETTGLKGNRSQRILKHGFYVLKNTNMAAFLIENGFMDSTTDVPIILSEAHAEKTAKGILQWLISTYRLVKSGSAAVESEKDTEAALKIGDKVKVLKAVTYAGNNFKTWHSVYDVISVKGDRVVIGKGNTITAAVNSKNLKKV